MKLQADLKRLDQTLKEEHAEMQEKLAKGGQLGTQWPPAFSKPTTPDMSVSRTSSLPLMVRHRAQAEESAKSWESPNLLISPRSGGEPAQAERLSGGGDELSPHSQGQHGDARSVSLEGVEEGKEGEEEEVQGGRPGGLRLGAREGRITSLDGAQSLREGADSPESSGGVTRELHPESAAPSFRFGPSISAAHIDASFNDQVDDGLLKSSHGVSTRSMESAAFLSARDSFSASFSSAADGHSSARQLARDDSNGSFAFASERDRLGAEAQPSPRALRGNGYRIVPPPLQATGDVASPRFFLAEMSMSDGGARARSGAGEERSPAHSESATMGGSNSGEATARSWRRSSMNDVHPTTYGLRDDEAPAVGTSLLKGPMFNVRNASATTTKPCIMVREYVQGMLISEVPRDESIKTAVPKRGGKSKAAKRAGETIFKGHRSYHLMLTLQLGISYTVGLNVEETDRPGVDFGRFATSNIYFPPEGSTTTPVHRLPAFRWKNYCHRAFRRLRDLFGVDPAKYMVSLCGNDALRELSSPGKSGSVFYLSHDDVFLIKTMRRTEMKVLLRMLPAYYDHMKEHAGSSLLTRFYGLHAVKIHKGRKVRFVVMGNLMTSNLRFHRRFDLKGSSYGRKTEKIDIEETTTLKDLDLDLGFYMHGGSEQQQAVHRQIELDCKFLESQRIMDYSLLLGVHFKASDPPPPLVTIAESGEADRGPLLLRTSLEGGETAEAVETVEAAKGRSAEGGGEEASKGSGVPEDLIAAGGELAVKVVEDGRVNDGQEAVKDPLPPVDGRLPPRPPGGRGASALLPEPFSPGSGTSSNSDTSSGQRSSDGGDPAIHDPPLAVLAEQHQRNMAAALSSAQTIRQRRAGMTGTPLFTKTLPTLGQGMEATAVRLDSKTHRPITDPQLAGSFEVVLCFGIIDILQEYDLSKRMEHYYKSLQHDSKSISSVEPGFYSSRFRNFMRWTFPDPRLAPPPDPQLNKFHALPPTLPDEMRPNARVYPALQRQESAGESEVTSNVTEVEP
eukprot:TRINITY_DN8872_c0_g2_i1.p1 TRINITY_DN8872_c0_g2~~TRINITY_DN8872_c0_g2_i1.p1  ORF type:complete len:1129 (-),score=236.74 TRINITY_DN8872_c0_g2_i1:716-3769(-)